MQSAAAESAFKDTRALLFKQPMTTETSSMSTSKSCFRLGLSAAQAGPGLGALHRSLSGCIAQAVIYSKIMLGWPSNELTSNARALAVRKVLSSQHLAKPDCPTAGRSRVRRAALWLPAVPPQEIENKPVEGLGCFPIGRVSNFSDRCDLVQRQMPSHKALQWRGSIEIRLACQQEDWNACALHCLPVQLET